MGADKAEGETYLNYVVPKEYGDANGFQAGSTFKVFVLAAAIKQGIPLSTPASTPPQTVSIQPSAARDLRRARSRAPTCWSPSNSTGSGHLQPLHRHPEVGEHVLRPARGAHRASATRSRWPATWASRSPSSDVVGPFTLGVTDTNPLTMAGAYATFAARGEYCDAAAGRPHPQLRAARSSRTTPTSASSCCPSAVADAVNDILRGVQEPGGFGYDNGLGLSQPSAGKTGTIQDNKAVWFIGYTPNLATAAMLAGANSLGHPITLNGQYVGGSYIDRAFGSTQAGPIWGEAMQRDPGLLPDVDFIAPDPNAIEGQMVTSRRRRDSSATRRRSSQRGLRPVIGRTSTPPTAEGTAAYTSPGGAPVGTARGHDLRLRRHARADRRHGGGTGDGGGGGNGGGSGGGSGNGGGDGNGNAATGTATAALAAARASRAGGGPPRRRRRRRHGPGPAAGARP